MERIKTKIRRWGNSFGVIIPKNITDRDNLKEGLNISITIEPEDRMTVGDLMKLADKFKLKRKGDTQKILDEIDKELWPEED